MLRRISVVSLPVLTRVKITQANKRMVSIETTSLMSPSYCSFSSKRKSISIAKRALALITFLSSYRFPIYIANWLCYVPLSIYGKVLAASAESPPLDVLERAFLIRSECICSLIQM